MGTNCTGCHHGNAEPKLGGWETAPKSLFLGSSRAVHAGGVHIWSVIAVSVHRGSHPGHAGNISDCRPHRAVPLCAPIVLDPARAPHCSTSSRGLAAAWKHAMEKSKRQQEKGRGTRGFPPPPPASGCHFSSPCRELAGPPAGTRWPPERSGTAQLRERGPCPAAACTYLKLSPQNDKGSAGDLSLPG